MMCACSPLAGPPGIGKTKLSLQAAGELGNVFPHGIFFVPLASIADPDLVMLQIAGAIGVREGAEQHIMDALMRARRGTRSCCWW